MKIFPLIIAAALNVAVLNSAFAAKDEVLIQTTRKNQLAYDAAQAAAQSAQPAAAKPLVLPLDHGPHAVVTPWVNQQRRLHAAEEAEKAKASNGGN